MAWTELQIPRQDQFFESRNPSVFFGSVECDVWHLQNSITIWIHMVGCFASSFLVVFEHCHVHTDLDDSTGVTDWLMIQPTASTCCPHGTSSPCPKVDVISAMISVLGAMFSFHWVPNDANLLQTSLSMHTGPKS